MRVRAGQYCVELSCSYSEVAVFLGGVMLSECIAADDKEGWVDINPRSVTGKLLMDDTKSAFRIERRYGRVEIPRWKRKKQ